MRVLHVMECTIGGARRHITEAARGQNAAGLDVHVAVSAERQPDFRATLAELEAEGVGVWELPMVREVSPRLDARHARMLTRHVRELSPDIVHGHSSKGGVLARWASLRSGRGRRVYSPHSLAYLHSARFGLAKRALYRTIERSFGRITDRMVAVSASEAETISASGVVKPERVRVVPNGIDASTYDGVTAALRSELGTPPDAPVAVLAGLMYEAKGQDLALEMLAGPGCESLHIWFAGTGEHQAQYEALARELGVAERAHFLGWRDDVPALLAAADFLLLPSRWEAMPYIVLEAMASRKPVVAARVDGVRDLMLEGETGISHAVGESASLIEACARMLALAPAERCAMGDAGRARVDADFSIDAMVQGLVGVYAELG